LPFQLNGFIIAKPPKDLKLFSYPVITVVAAGVTRVIATPEEFNGYAISVNIINQDGTNNALARVNGITTTQFNVPASGSVGFTDMWINQVEIIAGALGSVIVMFQMVSIQDVNQEN